MTNLNINLEKNIIGLRLNRRINVTNTLMKEEYTITHKTIHKYILNLLIGEFDNFKDLCYQTVNDMQVFFLFKDPEDKVSAAEYDFYLLQKKYFKYTTVTEPKPLDLSDPKEFAKHKAYWEKARNPKLNFV